MKKLLLGIILFSSTYTFSADISCDGVAKSNDKGTTFKISFNSIKGTATVKGWTHLNMNYKMKILASDHKTFLLDNDGVEISNENKNSGRATMLINLVSGKGTAVLGDGIINDDYGVDSAHVGQPDMMSGYALFNCKILK